MALFLNELSSQQVKRSERLLHRRRLSRIAFLILSYGFAITSGIACAALAAGAERAGSLFAASGISALAILAGILYARSQIRQSNRALDQSLDVLASTRAMAIEANISQSEQDRLFEQFRELQGRRERSFLGAKTPLIVSARRSHNG